MSKVGKQNTIYMEFEWIVDMSRWILGECSNEIQLLSDGSLSMQYRYSLRSVPH